MQTDIHILYFTGDFKFNKPYVKAFLDPKKACKHLLKDMIEASGENDKTNFASIVAKSGDIFKMVDLHTNYFSVEYFKYYSIDLEERTC